MSTSDKFFVYIIINDAGRIYVGQTRHLWRRLDEHNGYEMWPGARETADGRPWRLGHVQWVHTRAEALRLESAWKRSPRATLMALIEGPYTPSPDRHPALKKTVDK